MDYNSYMSGRKEGLPVIYSAHHAASVFPGGFANRTALSPIQQLRLSDYGTSVTVPRNGISTIVSKVSRGLVDLNRQPPQTASLDLDDTTLHREHDFDGNLIWRPGQETTLQERALLRRLFYDTYHDRILSGIKTFNKPGFVVGWDNTAHKELGKDEVGDPMMMKAFILSNKGAENRGDNPNEMTTCDPEFLTELAFQLARALRLLNLPDEVRLNYVYKGGYIPEHYNTRRHPDIISSPYGVQSFQVEYDTLLTHDQDTLKENPRNMILLRRAFEIAMHQTYLNYVV